jgi:membrane protease YdiL (CAAX protease family)
MEKMMVDPSKPAETFSFFKQEPVSTILRCIFFWMLFIGLLFLGGSFLVPLFPKAGSSMAFGVVGTIAAIVTIYLFLKNEKRSFGQVGLVFEWKSLLRFLSGYLIGTIIFAVMISILILFSDLELHKNHSFAFSPTIIISYFAFLPLAMMEELAFRSYPFVRLNSRFNFRITQLVIAIAFAAYHVIGGQGIISSLLGPGVWAYVFGLATIRSGGIAMPLGLHVAANASQAFAGMKSKNDAFWLLDYKVLPAANAVNRTEIIGISMHITMLVIAVLLTELYVRKSKTTGG